MSSAQLGAVLKHIHKLADGQHSGKVADRILLERFLVDQDEEAFTELVKRHGPMVLNVCRSVLHHWHDAEDAFQATFLVLARKASSIRRREALANWLWGVAHHVAMKAQTAAARRRKHEAKVDERPEADPVLDMTVRELQRVLYEELHRLPEKFRTPLILCYLQGHTHDEAARQLGWSKGTVRGRLNRGREQLRSRMARRGLALSTGLVASALSAKAASIMPLALIGSTCKASLIGAAGQVLAADSVSPTVAALANGAIKSMFLSKCKIAITVALALGIVAAGAGVLARQAGSEGSKTKKEAMAAKQPAPPASPQPVKHATDHKAPAGEVELNGQVLHADGKPFAGAMLHVGNNKVRDTVKLPVRATSGTDGRFQMRLTPKEIAPDKFLMAIAPEHGPDWVMLEKLDKAKEVKLQLPRDDVPVAGRLIDLEGKGMAGLTVRATHVEQHPDGLDGYIKMYRAKAGTPYFVAQQFHDPPMRWLRSNFFLAIRTTKTDKDGRFQFSGFGRDRIVHIEVQGEGTEHLYLSVLTRAENITGLPPRNLGAYATNFTYLSDPTKAVIGTIREKGTGKLLSGIRITALDSVDWPRTISDANGRYRIPNMTRRSEYTVAAEGKTHFFQFKWKIPDSAGLDPVVVDFYLERGTIVRGRLTDKQTGKPLKGKVHYFSTIDNPHLKDYQDLTMNRPVYTQNEPPGFQGDVLADGSFWVMAIPGPGYLGIQVHDERFPRAVMEGMKSHPLPVVENELQFPQLLIRGQLYPSYYNRIVPINPIEDDPKSLVCDVALEPGQSRTGTIVGPDGQALTDVHVAGLQARTTAHWFYSGRPLYTTLKSASFTANGLDSRHQRTLVFFHPAWKLAKVQTLRFDEPEPVKVQLEPLGSATGRLVDQAGRPLSGRKVTMQLSRNPEDYRELPYELNVDNFVNYSPLAEAAAWRGLTAREATTDKDGKFKFDSLVPGLKYEVRVYVVERKKAEEQQLDDTELLTGPAGVVVESGQARDVGKMPSKRITGK
jgi:RNA polymerase sigma factor (sigma-70 family)